MSFKFQNEIFHILKKLVLFSWNVGRTGERRPTFLHGTKISEAKYQQLPLIPTPLPTWSIHSLPFWSLYITWVCNALEWTGINNGSLRMEKLNMVLLLIFAYLCFLSFLVSTTNEKETHTLVWWIFQEKNKEISYRREENEKQVI